MPNQALDELGLVRDGTPIVIFFPSVGNGAVLPLRILFRENHGYETFVYGPLPVSFSGYDDGVIPAGQTTDSLTFSYAELPAEIREDMFYYTEPGKLLHAYITVHPVILRGLVEIPQNVKQYAFQDKITQDVTKDFGWYRGTKEMVFLPKIHIGWRYYNPTNLDLRTTVNMVYAEYRVELLSDAEVIYKILTHQYPAHWFTFGGKYMFAGLSEAIKVYGVEAVDYLIPYLPAYTPKQEYMGVITERVKLWRR